MASGAPGQRSAKTVLVVDDEPIVSLLVGDILAEAGFEVLQASDAEEALHILQSCDGIVVIVTDIEMPGMNGLELAAAVRKSWPDLGILVTSGRARPKNLDLQNHMAFLAKPCDLTEIVATVRDLAA